MTFMSVSIRGTKKLMQTITKKEEFLIQRLNKAIHNAGFFLEGEIKESIAGRRPEKRSFDTGNMMRSTFTDNSEFLRSTILNTADYFKYLEKGTSRILGRHHMGNSFRRNEQRMLKSITKEMKR